MRGLSNINPAIFAKRKRANKIGLVLSTEAMVLGMLTSILQFLLNVSVPIRLA